MLSFATKKRNANNPNSSLSNPENWFVDFITQGAARNKVNDKQSLGIPALYAAIGRRAKTIASLSWDVYQRTNLGAEKAVNHPLHFIISKQPHPLHNSYTFRQTLITHLDLYGNAYAEIIRDGTTRPTSFFIHHPRTVEDIQKVTSGTDVSYFYIVNEEEFGQTKRRAIPVGDMIHIKGLSIDSYFGISPVAVHNEMLAAGVAATEYENNFFQNNAHIAYAIEMPMQVSQAARQNIENAWKRFWGGVKNAFTKPFILDSGSKLHKVSLSPQEAMLTEAKKNTVVDVSRITDVPPHMLGAGENFTFSSVEVMVNDFVMYSIRNTVKQLESEFNLKCFTTSEVRNETYFTRFNIDSLLRGDTSTRSKKMETEVKWGIITKNEAREMMGYNKLEDGDTFLTPLNMTTVAESESQQ